MRAAAGPEPIRKALEVHLVNLIEDGHRGLLNKFVLQRRDAQRTLPPVRLRYVDSPRGLCRSINRSSNPVSSSCHVTPSTPGAACRFNAQKLSHSRSTLIWWSRAV